MALRLDIFLHRSPHITRLIHRRADVGGLYADNHDIADATLAWIAEGAVSCGLRLRCDTTFPSDLDLEKLPVHDSFRLMSNLWGLLGASIRHFARR